MKDDQTTLQEIKDVVTTFRKDRGWLDTDLKDVALSIVLEATEILEQFQWVESHEVENKPKWRKVVGDEIADVMFLMSELASRLEIDMAEAFENKIERQAKKYPLSEFGSDISKQKQLQAYYKIKAKTRGGHPLAEKDGEN